MNRPSQRWLIERILFRHPGLADRRRSKCRRLSIEGLEDRTLLSTITWNTATAPTGGDWDTPGNWVGGNVPGPSNAVVIDLTGAGTVTHNTNTPDSVLSLTTNSSTTLSLGAGSIALGNGSSTLGGPVTVGAAGTLSVGAGASVLVESTLSDAGNVTFATGDQVTFYGSASSVSGSLTANGTNFINDGATITFTSTATLSGGTNTFNLPIYVPYTLVPSLAGNTSFDEVGIEAGTISSGILSLNLLGTNTANFYYEFPNGFTVGAGGTMAVGGNVPVTVVSTLSDAGNVTFSPGDQVTLDSSASSVSGNLTANGTNFINGGSYITFTSTATLSGVWP